MKKNLDQKIRAKKKMKTKKFFYDDGMLAREVRYADCGFEPVIIAVGRGGNDCVIGNRGSVFYGRLTDRVPAGCEYAIGYRPSAIRRIMKNVFLR